MKTLIRLVLFTLISFCSTLLYGQEELPFYGMLGPNNLIIKNDSSGTYFYVKDSTKIIFIDSNSHLYRVFDKKYNILVEGDLGGRKYPDYYKQNGLWTEYYENGNIKLKGNYYHGNKIGLWSFFYPNGQLKETYNIALIETDSCISYCKVGMFQEYYENGKLKTNGFYRSALEFADVKWYENRFFEKKVFRKPTSKKVGFWLYYNSNGEIIKKEEYDYFD